MSKVTTGTARVRLCDKEASVAHELTPHTHQNARQANGFYSGPARWSNVASTERANGTKWRNSHRRRFHHCGIHMNAVRNM